MPVVKHPQFDTVIHEVSEKDVKSWTDSGWVVIAKKDEEAALAKAARPLQ
jgi:hypothetical protein